MAALPRLTIYERQQLAEWVCSEFNKVRKKKQNQCVYCRRSPAFLLRHLTENNVISGLQSRTSFSFCSVSQSLQPRCSSLDPRHQVVVCCRSRASLIPKKTKQKNNQCSIVSKLQSATTTSAEFLCWTWRIQRFNGDLELTLFV